MFVTKDIVINQIHRDGPHIAKSFDRIAENDLREISSVIADAVGLMWHHLRFEAEDFRSTCAGLLNSALSTFLASIEVARHGYRRPYGAIARGIVEALATTLHIAMEPGALARFHDGKLDPTKSVSAARKAFPPFGHLYGILSNHFVHINRAHSGLEPTKRYTKDEEPLDFILSNMRVHAWLIYVVTELVFYDDVPEPRYWKKIAQNQFQYDPSDDEMAWQRQFLGDETLQSDD
ncbi:hypothetical protein [Microvirga pudoricolor]|uniref:hypothetical protein n=1 Tax=Microvirga pudoricolor TaxID=2778729 RepID=UPI001E541824|nr:hypothetical protein [Microvirga pudoricolor]